MYDRRVQNPFYVQGDTYSFSTHVTGNLKSFSEKYVATYVSFSELSVIFFLLVSENHSYNLDFVQKC